MSTEQGLNPDIKTIHVGIKQIRPVKIYPLSISDQEKLTSQVVQFSDQFSNIDWNAVKNEEALQVLKKIIMDNLTKILEYVTDDEERPSFDELTNNQFYEIVNAIFEVNYEGLVKNFQDLFLRMKNLMPQNQKKISKNPGKRST